MAMEKIDNELTSLSELGNWKKEIQQLVKDFHQEDLVHGDLRLANFIHTKSNPCKMLLIDFDWGGKAGEVYYPRGVLAEELRAQGDQDDLLDRPITKEDDDRVLAGTFKPMDEIFAEWIWIPSDTLDIPIPRIRAIMYHFDEPSCIHQGKFLITYRQAALMIMSCGSKSGFIPFVFRPTRRKRGP